MKPFRGSEAVAAGLLTRGALRWNYSAIHPDVYLPNGATPNLFVEALAAWLWTNRTGIIAGRTAAAFHGVEWIGDDIPIEMIGAHRRGRPGVVIREERIRDDETHRWGELTITSPARTAFDLARRLPRLSALQHLDALAAKTGVTAAQVDPLVHRYCGVRGIRAARSIIGDMDGGARSRHQTRLRLMMLDAGLPKPSTNIVLRDEQWSAVLAMGWEEARVCLEHTDDLAGLNAAQRVERDDLLHRLGWFQIEVLNQHTTLGLAYRVRSALRRRS